MPLDQCIRKLGVPLYGLFNKRGLSSSGERSSVVRTNSQVVGSSNVYYEPSDATFLQVPPEAELCRQDKPSDSEGIRHLLRAIRNLSSGAASKPSLPVELWMKIIHELGHKEWVALSRVCWSLYQITQPCLYESIVLCCQRNPRREISNGRNGYSHPRFKRTIHRRPELGAYVCSLSLRLPIDDPQAWSNQKKRYPLLSRLYLFPNLESLHVWHGHFDLELCNILHSHPRLKSVTVAGCTLDESLAIARIDQDHFPHSSISTVEVLYPKRNPLVHAWAALAPAKLETLTVQSTSRASDAGLILNRIRKLNKTSFLTTLSLDRFSPAVVRFLIASPQLRHLILDSWMDESPNNLMSFSLSADTIPFLEEYSGPAEISSTFIRGRPVHTVKIISPHRIPEDRLVEILISLQYSTVPLTSLELSLWNATLGSWLSHIPVTVRYLTFDYLDWLDFEKWLPALSRLTSLQTLSFSGKFCWQNQKGLQGDEIMRISDTCQSLREINIGRQRWRIGGQRVWEPFTVFMD